VAPHQVRLRARNERAKALLADASLPLGRIADELGFCDEYHLRRTFRRVAGITPGSFRKSLLPALRKGS